MQKSESIKELSVAISKLHSEVMGAIKNKTNPHYKSDYADLESVIEATREQRLKYGISVVQLLDSIILNETIITGASTLITHSSGEWVQTFTPLPGADIQKIMAAFTYYRRGNLAGATGCPQVDDDGNDASNKKAPNKTPDLPAPKNMSLSQLKNYQVKVGKHKGKCFGELEDLQIKQTKEYYTAEVLDKTKPPRDEVKELVQMATIYLETKKMNDQFKATIS